MVSEVHIAGDGLAALVDTYRGRIADPTAGLIKCGDHAFTPKAEARIEHRHLAWEGIDDCQNSATPVCCHVGLYEIPYGKCPYSPVGPGIGQTSLGRRAEPYRQCVSSFRAYPCQLVRATIKPERQREASRGLDDMNANPKAYIEPAMSHGQSYKADILVELVYHDLSGFHPVARAVHANGRIYAGKFVATPAPKNTVACGPFPEECGAGNDALLRREWRPVLTPCL